MVRIRIYANAGAWGHWREGVGALAQGRMYTKAQTNVRKCEGEGALRRWRKFVGARQMYANAWVWGHWCGDGCTLTRGRVYTGADTYVP